MKIFRHFDFTCTMLPRLPCYVVIVTLIWGICVIQQIQQVTAENEQQIPDLFKSNLTRNEFSNLLQSLIKLNEGRVNVLKKISNLEDYRLLNEVLRSGDHKPSENKDFKNLYLIILSKNESNPTRRNMGEQVVKLFPSLTTANKLRKRSIVSTLVPVSNPIREPPDIEPQKALNIARMAKMNLRARNRYKIDDGSHLFSTLEPSHNLQVELLDTKRLISSEEETEENHSTSQPPRVNIKVNKQDKKAQGRFEIITNTNTNDYHGGTSISSFESKEKSNDYKDIDLTLENDRNTKLMKIQDKFSNHKVDKPIKSEKEIDSVKGSDNDGSKKGSESSEETNNKSVSIETYGEEKKEKEKTSRDYPEHNNQKIKNNQSKKYKLSINNENTREKPHYSNQSPPASRDNSDEYSNNNKKPKIMVGDSNERDYGKLNLKKEASVKVEQPYRRPKLIKTYPVDHDRRIHVEDIKSKENDMPNKASKVHSDRFSDDDHRISHEEKSYEKDNKEHKDKSEHSNEKSGHRINFNSKEHKSSEEDEAKKHKKYSKEDEDKSNANSHKSNEKHSNKPPRMTSDHFSDDDHRMSDKSFEYDLDNKHDLDSKHRKTSSNHNDNDHRISLDDFTKTQINKHKTIVRHSNENDHRPNQGDKSHEKQPTNKNKSNSKYSNEMNKSYEKEDKNHTPRDIKQPLKETNEQAHKVASNENKYKKKVMDSKIAKTTPKYIKDSIDHKPKNNVRNDQSNEDEGYKSHKDDVKHSEENDHKINDSKSQEKKNENDYKNTKINKDESKEIEPHGMSYSKPSKDAHLSKEDRKFPSPGSSLSHETPNRNGYNKINKDLPNKSDYQQPKDLSAHTDDDIISKPKHPSFEDDHGEKQSEAGKDYGGDDYRSTEESGKIPNTRVVMKDKPQEVKHSKPPSAEVDEYDQPGAKPQESRKNFVKCLSKKALKLCIKSCNSAYKNVCRKMKCTSRSKKALKRECKRSCKKTFASSKSSKYSDDSGSE
ncbi:unnamed protein product [Spodoptera littoralis]|uniref:Uncharacterized protein n=1 Tax=Spodoptera littoralis TaxID=7109 RepID=A0A9P0I960_SPOLI|nr:unnamed protein product [Spodoptera littoralis]CAH1642476.1 unnamed protein product [Spodoptera littoralis]